MKNLIVYCSELLASVLFQKLLGNSWFLYIAGGMTLVSVVHSWFNYELGQVVITQERSKQIHKNTKHKKTIKKAIKHHTLTK